MFKKLFIVSAVSLLAASVFAIKNQTLPTGGGFYEGTLYQPRDIAESNTTAYTPRFIGELLLGHEAGGSNALWCARGMTTNDWGLITAEQGPFGSDNIASLDAAKLTGTAAAIDGSAITAIGVGNIPLAAAKVIIGNAAGAGAAQTLAGDVTVLTNGTTAIGARKVVNTMLPQATDGQILVGMSVGGSNVVARSITGDITMDSNGVSAVASLPAISGAALTGLASANLAGNIAGARLTNACGVGAALIAVTNRGAGYTNVITFFGTFSGTVEP